MVGKPAPGAAGIITDEELEQRAIRYRFIENT